MEKQYFRNSKPISGIETDALWVKQGMYFLLVDDDDYFRVPTEGNDKYFYSVPKPDELKD